MTQRQGQGAWKDFLRNAVEHGTIILRSGRIDYAIHEFCRRRALDGAGQSLTLQGQKTEDYEIILGAKLYCMLFRRNGAYVTGASLQGAEWYNLYLCPRGWEYVEFTYAREEALDYLWPLTMLRLQVHASMPTDAVFLGDVDAVYTFMPSVHAFEGDARIEMNREELLAHLPERVTLGSIRRCGAREVDFVSLLEQSRSNWLSLREEARAFMQEEHTAAELRDGLNDLLSAPLHEGQTMMRLLGRDDDVKRLTELHHQVMRTITKGQPLRLADMMSAEAVDETIGMMIALTEQELQGECGICRFVKHIVHGKNRDDHEEKPN